MQFKTEAAFIYPLKYMCTVGEVVAACLPVSRGLESVVTSSLLEQFLWVRLDTNWASPVKLYYLLARFIVDYVRTVFSIE